MTPRPPGWQTISTPYEQLRLLNGEGGLALSRDNRLLYVTREEDVLVVDTTRGAVVHQYDFVRAPEVAGTSHDGRFLYARGLLGSAIQVVDTQQHTVERGYEIGVLSGGMHVSQDGLRLHVAARESRDNADGALLIINSATQTLVDKIHIGKNPEGIASHPTHPYDYILCAGLQGKDNGVYAVNTLTREVIHIPINGERGYIAISHDGSLLFVAQHHTRRINVIDTLSHQWLCELIVEWPPTHLAVSHDGKWLYVLSSDSRVGVFSTATLKHVRTLDTGATLLRGIKTQLNNAVVWVAHRSEEPRLTVRTTPGQP
ncbi:hypothetical protein NUV89_04620 [Pseudomonas sp. 18.1.10]|nr:hypothetical protein [Pseudomonas sp. 18.1.10]